MSGSVSLDHLAIAARDEKLLTRLMDEIFCGRRLGHTPLRNDLPHSAATWLLGEHKLEVLFPPISGASSLVGDFLARRPNIEATFHHVTFIVGKDAETLRKFRDAAQSFGFETTGYNEKPYK